MIIVQVIGGTASQMSAFSRGYTLAKKLNHELVLDISDYHNGYKFPYALDAFNINTRKLTYTHESTDVATSAVVPKTLISDFSPHFIQTNTMKFDEIYEQASQCDSQCIYLVGEGGVSDAFTDEMREIFTPRKESVFLKKFKTLIANKISIAVHIRRTDFVDLNWHLSFDYYMAAINYMKLKYPCAIFYFFSDDIDAVKQYFGLQDEYRYISLFGGADTDIDELLCMSMCSHRILTGKSGYSFWCAQLATGKDAINIVYSSGEHVPGQLFLPFPDSIIEKCLNLGFLKLETCRTSNIDKSKRQITTLIENQSFDSALSLISSVGFDSGSLLPTDKDDFFSFCELIHSSQGDLIATEQCLNRHLQFAFDSVDVNYNLAIVKWSLGKKLASYIHASKACLLSSDSELLDEFKSIFDSDKDESFNLLLKAPKMHFIICPLSIFHNYIKHFASLAILLRRMGHEVSIMNRGVLDDFGTMQPMDGLVKYSLDNPCGLNLSYDYKISGYNYFESPKVSSYIPTIEALIDKADLPSIVIGHEPLVCEELNYDKLIYWDFSCPLDMDSIQMLKNFDINKVDAVCHRKAAKAITTEKKRHTFLSKLMGSENVHLYKPYIDNLGGYKFIDEPEPFTSNFIDNDSFIRFAFDIVKLAKDLI